MDKVDGGFGFAQANFSPVATDTRLNSTDTPLQHDVSTGKPALSWHIFPSEKSLFHHSLFIYSFIIFRYKQKNMNIQGKFIYFRLFFTIYQKTFIEKFYQPGNQ